MNVLLKISSVVLCCACASVCEAVDATGPYKVLGVGENGVWTNSSCGLSLPAAVGVLAKGYVYTNKFGVVHQFNFEQRLSKGVGQSTAIGRLRETECELAKTFKLTPFNPHVDSDPNRYLWSEESSMCDFPGWSVRLYLENDKNTDVLIAKCSMWNALVASHGVSGSKTLDKAE